MAKNVKLFGLFILVVLSLSFIGVVEDVSANPDLSIEYLKIDGEPLDPYTTPGALTLEVARGESLPIRVRVSALNNDVEDVQVTAGIYGYRYSQYESEKVYDSSKVFDLEAGNTKNIDLDLEIPTKMDKEDLKLRIMVADRDSPAYIAEYELDVTGVDSDNAVMIKEAYLSPSNEVMAGRALSALVKVENIGDDDLDDITLIVSVPELNIRDTETLDELEADESETFEKIILRFPKDAAAGSYVVEYTVKFDEYESVTETDVVRVLECQDVACGAAPADDGKSVVQIPNTQIVTKGTAGGVYPIMINNMGMNTKAYTITIQGVDAWGTARIDPGSSVVIPAQSTATVFLYVKANDDTEAGEKYFKVSVGTDGDMREVPLSATVQEGEGTDASWNGLKRTLEVVLIILVIVLILIGLIVGFNKLRGSSDDDDDDSKTYY